MANLILLLLFKSNSTSRYTFISLPCTILDYIHLGVRVLTKITIKILSVIPELHHQGYLLLAISPLDNLLIETLSDTLYNNLAWVITEKKWKRLGKDQKLLIPCMWKKRKTEYVFLHLCRISLASMVILLIHEGD